LAGFDRRKAGFVKAGAFGNDGLQGSPLYGNAWIQGTTTGSFQIKATGADQMLPSTASVLTLASTNEGLLQRNRPHTVDPLESRPGSPAPARNSRRVRYGHERG
jgi:hypothetical protein